MHSRWLRSLALLAVAVQSFGAPCLARGEEHAIIRNPGDHPHYVFEAEPHGLVGFAGPFDSTGNVGLGFRGTFHVANGFVPSINDSVGVGVGIDFAGNGHVLVPIVMQWNFWLSTHWSVFAEPGIGIGSGARAEAVPLLFAGGRYHFTERIALTMRLGYPMFAIGVSFFL
jgi:hypothetical protein